MPVPYENYPYGEEYMFGTIFKFIKKAFGTQNDREIKKLVPMVEKINSLEAGIAALSDSDIKVKAEAIKAAMRKALADIDEELRELRERASTSVSEQDKNKYKKKIVETKNRAIEEYLPETFAIVREASKRTIGLRHFDVQMMGGLALHYGKIAEMATGEGKTLVATLAASFNGLAAGNVHVVTVNDYLAKRDSEWMGPIYKFLGLSVGVIQHDMRQEDRQKVYACDIVYGTNNEFGFDYLRDNMVSDRSDAVQRELVYAVVDEVDSILIDEARTPLIISGPVDEPNEAYNSMRPIVQEVVTAQRRLVRDYVTKMKTSLAAKNADEAGKLLYLVHKAEPKNRDFLDTILKDMYAKTLLDKAQNVYDSKVMEKEKDELLENLYYVFDEKGKEATISAKGQKLISERFGIEFMLEDLEGKIAMLADEDIPVEEKAAREAELVAVYTAQQKNVDGIKQLLKAFILFQKDVDYVIKDNKIVIVDEFTGRMMPGRRFSDGIHEAIEAKEQVEVQKESQTLATITLQNYFRMYDKLSGMTGTAKTEETEFEGIYLLPVLQIPTNRNLNRINMPDRIYKTEQEKFKAAVDEIAELHSTGRPVLVGTVSIEKSERLSKLLAAKGVKHNVLNAKYHEREAHIIAQAGRFGSVTIATNMAGRGTDILLGGNPVILAEDAVSKLDIDDPEEKEKVLARYIEEYKADTIKEHEKVVAAGGLHVLGTERHEARRIDNQLRGRSGRQGDPGSSRFHLSLEDDLMRIFGSDRIKMVMDRLGMEEGEVIENPLVTGAIQTAQKRVETQNFEIRKHLLKYDNVMNQQREVIYKRRKMVLTSPDLREEFYECVGVGVEGLLAGWGDQPDPEVFCKNIMYRYAVKVKIDDIENMSAEDVLEHAVEIVKGSYALREQYLGADRTRYLERVIMLSVIDSNWKEYLRDIDDLREGISWRAYGQKDPLVEFQHEAFRMFSDLMTKIDEEIAERVIKISAIEEQHQKKSVPHHEMYEHRQFSVIGAPSSGQDDIYGQGQGPAAEASPFAGVGHQKDETFHRDAPKVGRNDVCPCGSGKKYKKCCGK